MNTLSFSHLFHDVFDKEETGPTQSENHLGKLSVLTCSKIVRGFRLSETSAISLINDVEETLEEIKHTRVPSSHPHVS